MVIKNFLRFLGITSILFLLVSAPVGAMTADQSTLPGASNAADYQPPTGNPQNDVGGVSQGQSNQNDLQKPDAVNQTTLPSVPDLRVEGVDSETNTNTTKTEVAKNESSSRVWLIVAVGTGVVGLVVFALSGSKRRAKQVDRTKNDDVVPEKVETVEVIREAKPDHKPKDTAPKKATKRKKGKSKKTKRKR